MSLTEGIQAPRFTVTDTDGTEHRLEEMLQRGSVVLAFFPKAFTPG
jgi:thioredoxin-dependent peroxiredoxin